MIQIRKADERGRFDFGWLDTHHTFSFGDYHDPRHMGFRSLRVINEDFVQPGLGFGMHPHRDMEIFSYVLAGALQHRDSLGHGRVLRAEDQTRSHGHGGAIGDRQTQSALDLEQAASALVDKVPFEDVRRTQKTGNEEIGRILIKIGWRANLLKHAIIHDRDAIGERHGLDLVMRHIDGR